ncbi:hypothetical protein SeGA_1795, partial [Salmonella enterica subsp. enterica serovar Gaminara str. A4-567]
MKSVLLTRRQRSITVPGRNPGASRVRDLPAKIERP